MAAIKFGTILILISSYLLLTLPFLILFKITPQKTRWILNRIVSFYSKLVLKILGVKVKSNLDAHNYSHHLLVSNHLSYLDIMVLSSKVPSSFVTSIEMKNTPVLGQIVILAGCLFVERRSKERIKHEIKDIEQALTSGLNVIVFPEATSTNGEQVLKFKRSLFQSAVNVEGHVTPITINYRTLNGDPIGVNNRDYICWYGDMEFAPHMWELCQQKSIEVELNFSESLAAKDCTIELRDQAFKAVSEQYHPIS